MAFGFFQLRLIATLLHRLDKSADLLPRPAKSLIVLGAWLGIILSMDRAAASQPDRPNILFCIADDWGVHAGCYGTQWVKTPAFDRVAKEGLLFRRAYTPNAKCAPSRACLLTGRNSWQLKEAANHICYFPAEFRGWPEALTENGWTVGHTQKGWGPGIALAEDGTPRQMTGIQFNMRKLESPPTSSISKIDYAGNFTDFLNTTSKDVPWCFWYGAIEPHRDYEFGSGVAKGKKKLSDIERVPKFWPDIEEIRHDLLDYAYEIEHFDSHLGMMLDELEKRGQLDNTLVIVTSDHGPPFPRSKGNAYEMANHVPLAMMWKNGIQKPGRTIDDFVSFIDIAPTLLTVAGLSQQKSGMAEVTGATLTDIFQSGVSGQVNPERDHVLIGKERTDVGRPHDAGYPIRGIIEGTWIYIENFESSRWPAGNPETGYMDCDAGMTKSVILQHHRKDPNDKFWDLCFGIRPSEELYDLSIDPDCVINLAALPKAEAEKAKLRNRLYAKLMEQNDPRITGDGVVFDAYPHATQSNVGFYERFMNGEPVKAGWIDATDIEPTPGLEEKRRNFKAQNKKKE